MIELRDTKDGKESSHKGPGLSSSERSPMSWRLRYAPHLGFRSTEMPLFLASVGSADPVAQIRFIASLGFAGVQDPWFATRPEAVQLRMASALSDLGLASGCVVCGTPKSIRSPLWNGADQMVRAHLEIELRGAMLAARRIGANRIAVLTGEDSASSRTRQIETMITNLRWAADIVASEGLTLCLEPTNARTLTDMLLTHFDEGCEIARATGHAAVRMIFDTAHVQSMDGDLIGHLQRNWDLIDVIQIANHPGRLEPEVGEINMAAVLKMVRKLEYHGLVELEHLWSGSELEIERRGIDWLRQVDMSLI
jgi:hydroxypyruvate isomerase